MQQNSRKLRDLEPKMRKRPVIKLLTHTEELHDCRASLDNKQKELAQLHQQHEQKISQDPINSYIEELQDCRNNLDAKQKDAAALQAQLLQTQRTPLHCMM